VFEVVVEGRVEAGGIDAGEGVYFGDLGIAAEIVFDGITEAVFIGADSAAGYAGVAGDTAERGAGFFGSDEQAFFGETLHDGDGIAAGPFTGFEIFEGLVYGAAEAAVEEMAEAVVAKRYAGIFDLEFIGPILDADAQVADGAVVGVAGFLLDAGGQVDQGEVVVKGEVDESADAGQGEGGEFAVGFGIVLTGGLHEGETALLEEVSVFAGAMGIPGAGHARADVQADEAYVVGNELLLSGGKRLVGQGG